MESETPPRSVSDSIALFGSDRIRTEGLDSCFDAFSSREPVSTSLENALGATKSLSASGFASASEIEIESLMTASRLQRAAGHRRATGGALVVVSDVRQGKRWTPIDAPRGATKAWPQWRLRCSLEIISSQQVIPCPAFSPL